jgi:hypothetical protein
MRGGQEKYPSWPEGYSSLIVFVNAFTENICAETSYNASPQQKCDKNAAIPMRISPIPISDISAPSFPHHRGLRIKYI